MKKLKEHKSFRNQLIVITIILFLVGMLLKAPELFGFGIIYGIIALFNVFTYIENSRNYKKQKNGK